MEVAEVNYGNSNNVHDARNAYNTLGYVVQTSIDGQEPIEANADQACRDELELEPLKRLQKDYGGAEVGPSTCLQVTVRIISPTPHSPTPRLNLMNPPSPHLVPQLFLAIQKSTPFSEP